MACKKKIYTTGDKRHGIICDFVGRGNVAMTRRDECDRQGQDSKNVIIFCERGVLRRKEEESGNENAKCSQSRTPRVLPPFLSLLSHRRANHIRFVLRFVSRPTAEVLSRRVGVRFLRRNFANIIYWFFIRNLSLSFFFRLYLDLKES